MKKSSQIALGGSLVLFLAAGTVKFWPEDRFLPPTSLSAATAAMGGTMPAGMRGFGPGWAEPPFPVRPGSGGSMAPPMGSGAGRALPSGPSSPMPQGAPSFVHVSSTFQENSSRDNNHGNQRRVSLVAQNMPVGMVLSDLFHQAGVSYIPTERWGEPMTITFSDAPLEQVVSQTLSLTTRPRLACHIENGVYVVAPASLSAPPVMMQTTTPFR